MMIPELGIVFDAGTGMFRVRDLIQTKTLDIFMSHVHLDHSVGLTFLYDVLYQKNMERVTVHVAKEKIEAIENHLFATDLFPVSPNFELVPLESSVKIANTTVDSVVMDHPGGSHGFRISGGEQTLAYITDTTAALGADYIDFIKDIDVLVHECYFPDGFEDQAKLTGHSCLTPVAQVAAAANAGAMYLVHINPLNGDEQPLDLDSVKAIYAPITVATDKMSIEI
jgi:ribonuclease BN (tRNA processing enzyme)